MVPKRIVYLTELALKDGVMTFRERQVIESEGRKLEVDPDELKSFLDSALKYRISKETKETLQACPTCGGQIPLLSKECQYCGHMFGKLAANVFNVSEDDEAARIIEQENAETQSQKTNIQQCPNCGAPYPLICNICGHCNHVLHAPSYDQLNVERLTKRISKSLSSVNKSVPEFSDMLRKNWFLYITIINLLAGVVLSHLLGAAWTVGIMIVLFFTQFWFLSSKIKNNVNRIDECDRNFYLAQSRFDMLSREVTVLYGDHPEMKSKLEHFGEAITAVSNRREASRRKIAIVNSVFTIVSVAILFVMVFILIK